MKLFEKKYKLIEYIDNKIYFINNLDNEKLNEYSEYPIGSVTKLFIIISLLLLHQNNKINIFNKIGNYITNDYIKDLKIIDIINHKSGLKDVYDNKKYGSSKIKFDSATQVFNKYNDNNSIDNNMKNNFNYSNMGYHILGMLIENISKIKYSDFVKKYILVPLKMNNTGIEDCNITLYDYKNKKLNKYQKWERTYASSSGELKSNIENLIKFTNFTKLLKKETLDLFKNIYVYRNFNNEHHIEHGGGIVGSSVKYYITFDNKWKVKTIYISLQTAY